MNEKYKNKYRIQSNRMPGWDYSGNGLYFITLVTQNRECNLGEICCRENGAPYMKLSDFGKIVDDEWKKSFEMRAELNCDEYVIMPNHLHAIIVLKKPKSDNYNDLIGSHDLGGSHVETHGRASLQLPPSEQLPQSEQLPPSKQLPPSEPLPQSEQLSPSKQLPQSPQPVMHPQLFRKPKSISSFVGGFKSAINSKIDDYIDEHKLNIPKYNRNNHFFQPNYHDRIIRNENEYYRIKNYIINNPLNWKDDKFNPSNPDPKQ